MNADEHDRESLGFICTTLLMSEIFARRQGFQATAVFHLGSGYSRATAIFPN
jgi:hypothetical protein